MANARQFMATRTAAWAKSGYTAKDYVQDGLIAMWDGIENAGWGVHDPNATVWNDLIGSRNLSKLSGSECYFGENCLVNQSTNQGFANTSSPDWVNDRFSAQIVFLNDYSSGWIVEFAGNSGLFSNGTDGITLTKFYGKQNYIIPFGVPHQFSCCVISANSKAVANSHVYLDGSEATETTRGSNWTVDFGTSGTYVLSSAFHSAGYGSLGCKGSVYAIRIYGRDLTDAEIASNYAVDKARFGLT